MEGVCIWVKTVGEMTFLCETSSAFADYIFKGKADKPTFYGGCHWIRSLDTAELYLSACSLRFDWLRFRHFI